MPSALYAVMALFFLNGAIFGSWAAQVPAFKSKFDLSPDLLGLLLLCLAGGAILSFPVAGRAIDRHGSERISKGLAVAFLLSLPLLPLAPTPGMLAVALLIFGACFGALDVAMNAWGAEVESARGRALLPQLHALFSLGAGLGAAGAALAIGLSLSTLVHFILAGLVLAVATGSLILRGQSVVSDKRSAESGPTKRAAIFPKGQLLLVGFLAASTGLSEAAVADWSAVYLTVVSQATPQMAALGFAAFSISMVVIRLSGSWLVGRFGAVAVTRISGLLLTIGAGFVVFGPNAVSALLGFAIIGMGAALVIPLAFARAANDKEIPAGTAIAQIALMAYGGLLLGPPLIGFIADWAGYPVGFSVLIGLGVLVAALATSIAHSPLEAREENPEVTGQ